MIATAVSSVVATSRSGSSWPSSTKACCPAGAGPCPSCTGDVAIERELAEAAIAWLFDRGACVIRSEVPLGEPGGELLEALGFAAETVRYGLYRE